ncbi:MAG: hypothetical protein JWL83_269 [Actinomycetia bacterium]|nr:hypothetical protein [Actinomycetes bacterium]
MEPDECACPFCAETIKAAAVKCRWCNEFLNGADSAIAAPPPPPATETWVAPTAPNPPAPGRPSLPQSSARGTKAISCPHCGTLGKVSVKEVKQKKGISGAKATGAVLTAGLSIFATGLSRKEKVQELHCKHCGMTWHAA